MNDISKDDSLAHNLFYSWIDLWGLTPDYNKWNYDCLKSNTPRLIRLQRLQALFRALKIDWNPIGFQKGEFITNNLEMYKECDSTIFDDLVSPNGSKLAYSYEDLPNIFERLYKYRMNVENALSFNKGLLAIGDMYSYFVTSNLNISIKQIITPLDKLLISLIDPIEYEYTEEELVKYFDYPVDDLKQIDVDWT